LSLNPSVAPTSLDQRVPLSRPTLVGTEAAFLEQVLDAGELGGGGPMARRCEALLGSSLGRPVMLTTSCTHALELAALVLGLGPGDEVIVPSFTFPSTANAFALRGVTPVFADVRADTLNIDEAQLDALVTPRTRAVVPVHYAGVPCEMTTITQVATTHGLRVIEDNAHGLFGAYLGRPLGGWGDLAAMSFHQTKNLTSGEGGALAVADSALFERAEVIADKGTDRAAFLRGEVRSYSWRELGSSYSPSELVAAVLLAQLQAARSIQERRAQAWQLYARALAGWAAEVGAQLPTVPDGCSPAYHLFYLLMPDAGLRRPFMQALGAAGIESAWQYQPLNASAMGQALGGRPGQCPVAEDVAARLVRLPFFTDISDVELERVVSTVTAWRPGR
jgi:dTDP-4-amino-4,6-dideoxygalactose transaminase